MQPSNSNLLEEVVGAVDDGPRQVDAVGHVADLFEGVDQRPVRAAHLQRSPTKP